MARMYMSSNSQTGKMRNQAVFRFLLLYNVFETVYRIVQAADGRTHAFVHVDGDLRYLMDGVSVEMQEFIREEDTSAVSFSDLNEENLNAYASPIAFHPPMLNFHFHPVGMPHMERVYVQNLSPDTSIHMLSISGNTLHTHCSFFQDKIIPPGGNTSFDVVLLAREEGTVEDTLFIHTSLGSFKFQVSAVGIPNPYRLRPFVGVRMPLNSSYSPIIYMHNPHSSTLQLTEMYSSGGDLHLELPDGESEASKSLWEIPPYETKPIIKANFIARIEKNHTAFIRIRTNSSQQDYLLLPVEVDVSSAAGIYSLTEVLHFGMLRSQDEPKVLTLSLLNAGQKHVHIVNVIATPVNEAVDVKFMPIKVAPDTVFSTQVATITFNPSKAVHPKQCCGKIVIKSKNNQYKLQIPYQVNLIRGFLDYNKNCTKFYVGLQNSNNTRELNVTNSFNVVLIIYNISLPDEAKLHFTVKMTEPVILKPGQSSTVAFITLKPTVPNLQLTSYLRLHTNISHFDIPLLCFTGHLKVFLPHAVNESFIDFGTLGMGDKRIVVFAVINENPVDVNLKFWGSNASKTYVELVGVDKGNASTLAWRQNFSSMARSLILKPQHYGIFRIGITAPNYEGLFHGQAFVETQYEKINVPFSLRTAKGALRVEEIVFENSFPGKISTQSLYVYSTFSHSMTITGITTVPEDSRFVFDLLKHGSPVLYPNSRNMVGKIHFDHRKYCKLKCYSGLPTTTSMGHQWLLGMALPQDVGDTDKELFRTLCKRWQSFIDLGEKTVNITLRLDTTEVRGYLLKAHASLQWPRLFNRYRLKFPITQIGNHTVKDFTLENPSSLPLLVQVVPLSLYPNPANIVSALREKYDDFSDPNIIKDSGVFSLEDLEENNPNPENHIPAYRKSLEEFFGVQSHKKSIAMLLTPGMRVRIQVGFTPVDDAFKSSLILIRNNLTVMDALLVQGQGGHGQIKFGNISPGSDSVLMFELTERLLKDCDSFKSPKYTAPNFTVRRAFTARNTGALPIYIKGFDINGKPCQGYGFRVLNCQGFELKPNASRKIDIAYTPDFSLTHIQRTLNIRTSQGPDGQILQFNVVATVPRHLLAFCSQAIPRPYWEQYVYICFLSLSTFLILTVIICAYLDSKRILHTTFFPFITIGIHADKIEKENVFDLKAICASTIDTNSFIKESYQSSEARKKKENTPETINVSENNSVFNSMKSTGTLLIKRKDSVSCREFEDHILDSNRHTKKRSSKSKQIHENCSLEPDLVEIKKSQPRNSWTRFLKPPFSFHSCSNVNNKPSVATQTTSDNADDSLKSLKELDIIGDQNINCFLNIENNARCKAKNKNESKFIETKNCVKKLNDNLPEEETSSTTTETSTTESDISEKDHRLPDVCVTSKTPKSRFVKNKTRGGRTDSGSRISTKSSEIVDAEGFELSTKSRGHKKIKVDPNKVFRGDILRPSTLELPYKPKPVMSEKLETLERSGSEDSPSAGLSPTLTSDAAICCPEQVSETFYQKLQKLSLSKTVSQPLLITKDINERNAEKDSPPPAWDISLKNNNESALNDIVERTSNFAMHQGYHNCLWYKSAVDNSQSLSHESSFPKCPSSYSAVLSRDIMSQSKDISNINSCSINRSCLDTYKPMSSSRPKHTQTCYSSKNSSKPLGVFSPSIWTDNLGHLSSSESQDNLSGSKLKNWMVQSNPECCSSALTQHIIPKTSLTLNDHRLLEMYDSLTSDKYNWIQEPPTQVPSDCSFNLENNSSENSALFGDWPGINLPPVGESLWDSNYNPSNGSWTDDNIESELPLNTLNSTCTTSSSVWNNDSLASVWKSDNSSWSSPSCDNCSPVGGSNYNDSANMDSADSKNIPAVGEFDPFHTPSALWMSQLKEKKENYSRLSETSTWSFSLFSDPSTVLVSNSSNNNDKEEDADENENSNPAV